MDSQQYACEVFDKIPHIKPSPPESAAMGGILLNISDGFADDFPPLPQQITACSPLASMAQKKASSSPPNAAAMGPIDPKPDAGIAKDSRKRREEREIMAIGSADLEVRIGREKKLRDEREREDDWESVRLLRGSLLVYCYCWWLKNVMTKQRGDPPFLRLLC